MSNADISLTRGEVLMVSPESKTGFPIRHDDWEKMQVKIRSLQKKRSFWRSFGWKDIGMLFLGIGLTSIISFWLPGYTDPHQHTIAALIMIISFLFGGCCIFFQHQLISKEDENINVTVSNIIELMDFIAVDYSGQVKENQNR